MQFGWTALMWASNNGHLEVVDLLIRHGARVRREDKVMWGKGWEGVPVWMRRVFLVIGMFGIRVNMWGHPERDP